MKTEVRLADDESALTILHEALLGAQRAFEDSFAAVGIPADVSGFRKQYTQLLPEFETARLAGKDRLAAAAHIVKSLEERIVFGDRPLAAVLGDRIEPLPLMSHEFASKAGWQPNVTYRGKRYDDISALGAELANRGSMTRAAARSLEIIANRIGEGVLDLSERRIAVLGAGAEMAPTRLWLEAGADVLWIDTRHPPEEWWEASAMSGRLHWCPDGADLLAQPAAVLATISEFAAGSPIDVCLYAYAPGRAREVRLTAAMNAIVKALPVELVASVTMLVSPTTPTALSEEDVAAMDDRRKHRPGWETLLDVAGLLGRGGGRVERGEFASTRTVVGIQGASYQAAQYIGKVLTAECWSRNGLRVSANTAAITRTRSLAHPVFSAAFGGAAAFGVETLTPRQSRRINGLLAVSDWLEPECPQPGWVRVHGGIHTLPYPLESALRVAAGIGFVRSPKLLRGPIGKK